MEVLDIYSRKKREPSLDWGGEYIMILENM